MISKFKKLWFLSLIFVGSVCLACGCGGSGDSSSSIDWSSMNYGDYHSLYANEAAPEGTEGYWDYWDTKTIEYQFVATTDTNFPTLLNLYEDGSAKAWMCGSMLETLSGATTEESKFYSDNKVIELFYGYWVEDDSANQIALRVQNAFDYTLEGAGIQYELYTIDLTPDSDGVISFSLVTDKGGQYITVDMECDTTYEGTIQYSSFVNFASEVL